MTTDHVPARMGLGSYGAGCIVRGLRQRSAWDHLCWSLTPLTLSTTPGTCFSTPRINLHFQSLLFTLFSACFNSLSPYLHVLIHYLSSAFVPTVQLRGRVLTFLNYPHVRLLACCDWLPRATLAPSLYGPRGFRYFPFCARPDRIQDQDNMPFVLCSLFIEKFNSWGYFFAIFK